MVLENYISITIPFSLNISETTRCVSFRPLHIDGVSDKCSERKIAGFVLFDSYNIPLQQLDSRTRLKQQHIVLLH